MKLYNELLRNEMNGKHYLSKKKIQLLKAILENSIQYQEEWTMLQEKNLGIVRSNAKFEGYAMFDVLVRGPATFGGYANSILTSLQHSKKFGVPPKPRATRQVSSKTIATVWPPRYGIKENLEAFGMTGEMVCSDIDDTLNPLQMTQDESIQHHSFQQPQEGESIKEQIPSVAAVLAPGNFDAPTDLLCELFIKGRVCVYKPNPINDATVGVLIKIFEPCISRGYVSFIPSSIPSAKALVQHKQVQEIILTGSQSTLDRIKWGGLTRGARTQQEESNSNQQYPNLCRIGSCHSLDNCSRTTME